MMDALLMVEGLDAWYGRAHVLQSIDLRVRRGEVVALLGRNGVGKTSFLKGIMGLMPRYSGSVRLDGNELVGQPTHLRFRVGLAYVPEDRRIVPGLTVRENIRLGLAASPYRNEEDAVLDRLGHTFPRLCERLNQMASSMSGGEQQMLAIARALAVWPRLLMLDEPSEGVMPILVDEMYALFAELKAKGCALLLVEQDVERALEIADRVYVLDQGRVAYTATAAAFRADTAAQARWCAL
jgi:branched-chain amino acid transport system ATP-binding protein